MKEEIEQAASVILSGGVLLYPTDTVWGLGCNPQSDRAIEKICRIKQRSETAQFIILVNSEFLLNKYTEFVPDICYDLMEMATSPLTIIYPKGRNVSDRILAPDGSIGIRMVNHPFCSGLMNRTKTGLVSTSANISGKPFPASFNEIADSIINSADYAVNLFRDQQAGKPSQIIKIGSNGEFKIIRR